MKLDSIEIRKELNRLMNEAKAIAKPDKCILCGKKQSSFCNSHSVPKMILKNIANNGKVLTANATIGIEVIDDEKGVNNSGTFNFICRECDKKMFQDYENPNRLSDLELSDKLLSEIALKDTLLMLSKRNFEKSLYKIMISNYKVGGLEPLFDIQNLDTNEYLNAMKLHMGIKKSDVDKYQIVYKKLLPYTVPFASQTMVALDYDLEGVEINDKFDLSEENTIENLHIAVFPLEEKTLALVFYHRKNRKYKKFRNQFNCLSDSKKLELINYWIFKYTEHYYFSPLIKDVIENNEQLSNLSREVGGTPNLGFNSMSEIQEYKTVKEDEIPNLLLAEYSIEKLKEMN